MLILRCIIERDLFRAKQEKIQSNSDVKTPSWGKRDCFLSGSSTTPKVRRQCIHPEVEGSEWAWPSVAFSRGFC